jgi:hypothetical protein
MKLKPTTMYLNEPHMRRMKAIAESRGLKQVHLVRIAISEYLQRNPLEQSQK